jgi:hypothetical protein
MIDSIYDPWRLTSVFKLIGSWIKGKNNGEKKFIYDQDNWSIIRSMRSIIQTLLTDWAMTWLSSGRSGHVSIRNIKKLKSIENLDIIYKTQ